MFLYIMANQLCGWPIISHVKMLFYPLYYDKPNKSKNHTGISFITCFYKESNHFCDFKI